jgi:hypothetical protein
VSQRPPDSDVLTRAGSQFPAVGQLGNCGFADQRRLIGSPASTAHRVCFNPSFSADRFQRWIPLQDDRTRDQDRGFRRVTVWEAERAPGFLVLVLHEHTCLVKGRDSLHSGVSRMGKEIGRASTKVPQSHAAWDATDIADS